MQNSTAFICTVVTAKLHADCAYAHLPHSLVTKQSCDVGTQTNNLVHIQPSRANHRQPGVGADTSMAIALVTWCAGVCV